MPTDASDTTTIPVSGMTCAACSARVQRSLEKVAGRGQRQRESDDRLRHGGLRSRGHHTRAAGRGHSRHRLRRRASPAGRQSRTSCSMRRTRCMRRRSPSCAASWPELWRLYSPCCQHASPRWCQVDGDSLMRFMMPLTDAALRPIDGSGDAWRYLLLRSHCRWWAGPAATSTPGRGPRSGTTGPT